MQRVLNLIPSQICEQISFLYRLKPHLEKFTHMRTCPPPNTHTHTHTHGWTHARGVYSTHVQLLYMSLQIIIHSSTCSMEPVNGLFFYLQALILHLCLGRQSPPQKKPVLFISGGTHQTRRSTFYKIVILGCHIWNYSLFGCPGSGIANLSGPAE
jgi:hypothetical protein